MKQAHYVKLDETSMYLYMITFEEDDTDPRYITKKHFSECSDLDPQMAASCPPVDGYKGPVDPTTGNSYRYEAEQSEESRRSRFVWQPGDFTVEKAKGKGRK